MFIETKKNLVQNQSKTVTFLGQGKEHFMWEKLNEVKETIFQTFPEKKLFCQLSKKQTISIKHLNNKALV